MRSSVPVFAVAASAGILFCLSAYGEAHRPADKLPLPGDVLPSGEYDPGPTKFVLTAFAGSFDAWDREDIHAHEYSFTLPVAAWIFGHVSTPPAVDGEVGKCFTRHGWDSPLGPGTYTISVGHGSGQHTQSGGEAVAYSLIMIVWPHDFEAWKAASPALRDAEMKKRAAAKAARQLAVEEARADGRRYAEEDTAAQRKMREDILRERGIVEWPVTEADKKKYDAYLKKEAEAERIFSRAKLDGLPKDVLKKLKYESSAGTRLQIVREYYKKAGEAEREKADRANSWVGSVTQLAGNAFSAMQEAKENLGQLKQRALGVESRTFDFAKKYCVDLTAPKTLRGETQGYLTGKLDEATLGRIKGAISDRAQGAFKGIVERATGLGEVVSKNLEEAYAAGANYKLQTAIQKYERAIKGGSSHEDAWSEVDTFLTTSDGCNMIRGMGLPAARLKRGLRETFGGK